MRNKVYFCILSAAFFVAGCATYESKPVPVRPASSYTLQARPQYAAPQAQPQYQYTAAPPQQQVITGTQTGQPLPLSPQPEGQVPPPPPPGQVAPYQPVPYAGTGLSIGADV